MEREDTEKAHRDGRLKCVLEEAGNHGTPELIDPDEYEESMPDLDRGRLDDGGTIPVFPEPAGYVL